MIAKRVHYKMLMPATPPQEGNGLAHTYTDTPQPPRQAEPATPPQEGNGLSLRDQSAWRLGIRHQYLAFATNGEVAYVSSD